MFLQMLLYILREYLLNRVSAIFIMPARIFLAYQDILVFSLLMVINTGLVFGPVCKLSSLTETSYCAFVNDARGYTLPYTTVFNSHSETLSDAMDGTKVAEASLLDLTQAHIAVDNLVLLVDHSHITRKSDLKTSLERLREETRVAGPQLQGFSLNLGGSIEQFLTCYS